LIPAVNVTKHFFFVTYTLGKSARVFVLGKPFQPSLLFTNKAGVESLSGKTRLKKAAKEKHLSSFAFGVSNEENVF
jgi:hypothetical protein